jgi:hypothetical protein
MAVWQCSVPPVRRWVSTSPLRPNGKRMTGKQEPFITLPPTMALKPHRLLYRPQFAVDGNMKLVHLIMKRPEDDVSLSDGGQFLVRRPPYAEHLAHAPERQPVSAIDTVFNFQTKINEEIEM